MKSVSCEGSGVLTSDMRLDMNSCCCAQRSALLRMHDVLLLSHKEVHIFCLASDYCVHIILQFCFSVILKTSKFVAFLSIQGLEICSNYQFPQQTLRQNLLSV